MCSCLYDIYIYIDMYIYIYIYICVQRIWAATDSSSPCCGSATSTCLSQAQSERKSPSKAHAQNHRGEDGLTNVFTGQAL